MTGGTQMIYNGKASYRQAVLLSPIGVIQDSCDSLFDTSSFRSKSIGNYFYFLASELPTILASEADRITYNQMQTTQECLPGYYDFTFSKVMIDGTIHILWEIFDYTNVYEEYVKVQQIKNEIDIHEQFLSRQKHLSSNEKKAYTANFFQSEYIAKQKLENENLVYQLIHCKKESENLNENRKTKGLNDLVNLKDHLELMINEINQFLVQVKKGDSKSIVIRDLIDGFRRKSGSLSSDTLTIIYSDSLPNEIHINGNVLSQIISLTCQNDWSQNVNKNASLSVSLLKDGKAENPFLSLNYIEQLPAEANLNDDSAKRVVKLSILKSLVTTLGGTLMSKYSSDNHIFGVLLSLPIKNC